MRRWTSVAAGCCAALLVACGSTAPEAVPASHAAKPASLPRFEAPFDEEFIAQVTLTRLIVDGVAIHAPIGLALPEDANVVTATEATLTLLDDPGRIREAAVESLCDAGYETVVETRELLVWSGHGMAIRLELRPDAQQFAWAPEDRLPDFVAAP